MATTNATNDTKDIEQSTAVSVGAGNTSQALNIFAENLLVEKGAYRLDAQTAGIMKQEIVERLELLVNKVSLAALNDDQLMSFNKLLEEKATPEQLQKYISDNVPDLKERLTEAFYRFRLTYLGTRQ